MTSSSQLCFDVVIEHDDHGLWVTYVPALNNISTFGDTREEALEYTREMIEGYIIVSAREGMPLGPARPHALQPGQEVIRFIIDLVPA